MRLALFSKKIVLIVVSAFLLVTGAEAAISFQTVRTHYFPPADLKLFESCYPDVIFDKSYDTEMHDWKLVVTARESEKSNKSKSAVFYWADGRMLPKEEMKEKQIWWSLLYNYDKELRDPETYTEEEVAELRVYGTKESQMNTAGSPMFFFDFLYDAYSQKTIERHIVKTTFLGKKTKVHERIAPHLKRVEERILAKKGNADVKSFIDTLTSADAYFWRQIANTTRKSFHSYGIAIDILPKRLYGKQTYWQWAKAWYGDNWMKTPLSERWMPPKIVRDIFESEGFIWGGKWTVWDTMHFEYHPELIKWNGITH